MESTYDDIKTKFSGYKRNEKLSLDQLRKIKDIINEGDK
jgi:hypothetical protein